MAKRNALAELAERLKGMASVTDVDTCDHDTLDKTNRIVEELAKVEDVTDLHNLNVIKRPNVWHSVDAISKCRAIAEEREVAK